MKLVFHCIVYQKWFLRFFHWSCQTIIVIQFRKKFNMGLNRKVFHTSKDVFITRVGVNMGQKFSSCAEICRDVLFNFTLFTDLAFIMTNQNQTFKSMSSVCYFFSYRTIFLLHQKSSIKTLFSHDIVQTSIVWQKCGLNTIISYRTLTKHFYSQRCNLMK